jgi:hypothetical protein
VVVEVVAVAGLVTARAAGRLVVFVAPATVAAVRATRHSSAQTLHLGVVTVVARVGTLGGLLRRVVTTPLHRRVRVLVRALLAVVEAAVVVAVVAPVVAVVMFRAVFPLLWTPLRVRAVFPPLWTLPVLRFDRV